MANSSGLGYEKEAIKNSNILRSIVLPDGQSPFLDDEQMRWGGGNASSSDGRKFIFTLQLRRQRLWGVN